MEFEKTKESLAWETGGSRAQPTPQDWDRRAWDTSWNRDSVSVESRSEAEACQGSSWVQPPPCSAGGPSPPPAPSFTTVVFSKAKAAGKGAPKGIHPETGDGRPLHDYFSSLFPFKVFMILGPLHLLSCLRRGAAQAFKAELIIPFLHLRTLISAPILFCSSC